DVLIEPKIAWSGVLRLANYAYDVGARRVGPELDLTLEHGALSDILVSQFCAEARRILARGRHKNYKLRRAVLMNPRGRLDIARLVVTEVAGQRGLPCSLRPRSDDVLLNRL